MVGRIFVQNWRHFAVLSLIKLNLEFDKSNESCLSCFSSGYLTDLRLLLYSLCTTMRRIHLVRERFHLVRFDS